MDLNLPERRLACAVLVMAITDYESDSQEQHRDAAEFLQLGNATFTHWCHVAGVEPDWFLEKLKKKAPR